LKKICIITSGQPTANPRALKEAIAFDAAGYNVTVIYCPISAWADKFDKNIFLDTPGIEWITTGFHSTGQNLKYKLARYRRKVYEFLFRYNFLTGFPENAIALYSPELKRKAKAIEADIYIAHNLGALPAAVAAGKKNKACIGFDAEDFHRGEAETGSLHYRVAKAIEDKNLPAVNYVTAASPLIAKKYGELYPGLNIIPVNNVFSQKFLKPIHLSANNNELNLFWFSQIIGKLRGLENIIRALNILKDCNISFHLLGSCTREYRNRLLTLSENPGKIFFYEQVPSIEIFEIAARFDIGVASEIPYCENRDICLTNKIFTYLLAGNCILASDTAAQTQFLNENTGIGLLYDHKDVNDTAGKIYKLYTNRELVNECRKSSHNLAIAKYNWETEFKKILGTVNNLFCHN
jgi:glycosyltransferase involved in cell wall biosynthesis